MKIKRVRIENFDEITSFIGPTGVAKSTVLCALDWFFNGERSVALTTEDVHSAVAADDGERISVEVEFDSLTEFDRTALGRYGQDHRQGPRVRALRGDPRPGRRRDAEAQGVQRASGGRPRPRPAERR
ncbi:hypothetical protein [Streptomyces sp. NPDC094032]|uniref:hypothetical protein n=1 Tax=Streptomyces sp. NPDC094032 TaxID=3155308 RepID=UPI0033329A35